MVQGQFAQLFRQDLASLQEIMDNKSIEGKFFVACQHYSAELCRYVKTDLSFPLCLQYS